MRGTELVHHEATKTNGKQDAAYIRQFHKALQDLKTKSKQHAVYIHHFHASPKSTRSHLKPKVNTMLWILVNFVKQRLPNRSYIRQMKHKKLKMKNTTHVNTCLTVNNTDGLLKVTCRKCDRGLKKEE